MRDVRRGLGAAAAALLVMAAVALAALLLLGAGRSGDLTALTATVVALAVGGSADVVAVPSGALPITVHGAVDVMPLGVSLAGAVVLGALVLRHGRDGLAVRVTTAVVGFVLGLAAISLLSRGNLAFRMPGGTGGASACGPGSGVASRSGGAVDAGFSAAFLPTVAGAAVWALVVAGVCVLAVRFPAVVPGLRLAATVFGVLTVGCALVASGFGGAAAAAVVLLALPQAVSGALVLGLGVPWTVTSSGALSCAVPGIEQGGGWIWVPVVVLTACAVVAARSGPGGSLRRAGVFAGVTGGALAVVTLLSRVSVDLGVTAFGLSIPVLDARLSANPLLALAAGAAAGFASGLLAGAISVSSRAWKR
ncbi:streptophobe family protein [Amycolatopsis sp. NPDC049252]|uniref:streptophobe family protein n=1 Tax=Amycolatopsis sp. NPDC049252 TaxID=3363933 RepID=UPI00371B662A